MNFIPDQIKRRKLIQWTLTYLAGAWLVMQVVDVLADRWSVPLIVQRGIDLFLLMGLFVALVLAWYHGEKGRQHVSGSELLLLALLLATTGLVLGLLPQVQANAPGTDLEIRQAIGASVPLEHETITVDPMRIAVFPFRVQASPEVDYLSEGLMDLLSEALDGVGDLRRVDPFAIMSRLRQARIDTEAGIELAAAREIARRLGAGLYLLGSLTDVGDSIRLTASVFAPSGNNDPVAVASARGTEIVLTRLVEEIGRDLVQALPAGRGLGLERVGTIDATNYSAFRAYLRGEALMRRGWFDSAGAKFSEAVAADSMFALGWLRLWLAQGWGATGDMSLSIRRALELRDRLTARDQLLADATRAFNDGDGRRADELARMAIGQDPQAVDALFILTSVRQHYRWQLGTSLADLQAAIDRLLQIDPDFPPAISMAVDLAVTQGQYERAKELLPRAPSGGGAYSLRLGNRAALAYATGDVHAQARVDREFASGAEYPVWAAIDQVLHTDSLAAGQRLLLQFAEKPDRSEWAKATGQIHLAYAAVARGRWSEAEFAFGRAAGFAPQALPGHAILAAVPFFDRPTSEVLKLKNAIERWSVPEEADRTRIGGAAIPPPVLPWLREYTLGLLSARLGDSASAVRYANVLRNAATPNDPAHLRNDLADEISALVSLMKGQPELALTQLDNWPGGWTGFPDNFQPLYRRPIGRWIRAEALYQLGHDVEALNWYSTFIRQFRTWEYAFLAPAFFRTAEILDRHGEFAHAVVYYTRFIDRWREADEEYQPLVNHALSRLSLPDDRARR